MSGAGSIYPMVPGHEIVGTVTAVGADVTKVKAGDVAGVGVMVNSCRECANCKADLENYCMKNFVGTYNAKDYDGAITYGGYSNNIVCDMRYVHTISPKFGGKLEGVAPLLCAGITTYSPMRHWKAGPGKKVGVVGLGGLGHMGLKFAHSFGAHVVQFTTSESKVADAKRLGADEVVISKDAAAMAKHAASFDFILDTVSAPHNLNDYLKAAEAGLDAVPGGTERRTASGGAVFADRISRGAGRVEHWRHEADAGNAGLLRGPRHCVGC